MPESELVDVIWTGPFEADLIEGGSVSPGQVIQVTPQQAAESAWFQPVNQPAAPKKAAPKVEEAA